MQQNTVKLTTPVAANLPIAIMFKQIENCQRFAVAGNAAFTPAQLLQAADTLILATGRYKDAYRTWLARPAHKKNFNNFRDQFVEEYLV